MRRHVGTTETVTSPSGNVVLWEDFRTDRGRSGNVTPQEVNSPTVLSARAGRGRSKTEGDFNSLANGQPRASSMKRVSFCDDSCISPTNGRGLPRFQDLSFKRTKSPPNSDVSKALNQFNAVHGALDDFNAIHGAQSDGKPGGSHSNGKSPRPQLKHAHSGPQLSLDSRDDVPCAFRQPVTPKGPSASLRPPVTPKGQSSSSSIANVVSPRLAAKPERTPRAAAGGCLVDLGDLGASPANRATKPGRALRVPSAASDDQGGRSPAAASGGRSPTAASSSGGYSTASRAPKSLKVESDQSPKSQTDKSPKSPSNAPKFSDLADDIDEGDSNDPDAALASQGRPSEVAAPPPGGWSKALQRVEGEGLSRYTKTQVTLHKRAVGEVYNGKKCSCWMWFCIPTPPYMVNGVEQGSARNRMYAIRTDDEARSFLTFEADGVSLRDNYYEIITATRDMLRSGTTARAIFGFIDEPKLKSSVKYFEQICRGGLDPELNTLLLETMRLLRIKPENGASADTAPAADGTTMKRSTSQPPVSKAAAMKRSSSQPPMGGMKSAVNFSTSMVASNPQQKRSASTGPIRRAVTPQRKPAVPETRRKGATGKPMQRQFS